MYGFGEKLSKQNILKRITSYDIFKFYSTNFSYVGKSFPSDLRSDDKNPSAQVNMIGGDLLYTDFGLGKSFRCIEYVMFKYNLNYFDALNKINTDFNLKLGQYSTILATKNTPVVHNIPKGYFREKTPTILQKKQRDFTSKDLQYWNSFYWTESMLIKSKTQSISNYWVDGEQFNIPEDYLAFSYEYYFHNGIFRRKLYFPEETTFKWLSNVDNTIVQLVDVMPKNGDVLFITSSKKDAGIFWRLQIDNYFPNKIIHGVAPNNEGAFVPEEWFNKVKGRWKKVVLWYNNDEPGIKNSIKYSEKYNIQYIVNPENTPKDPSDFSRSNSLYEFSKLVKDVI